MIIQKTEKIFLSSSEHVCLGRVMRMMSRVYDSATFPALKESAKQCLESIIDFIDFADYYDDYAEDSEEEKEREGEDLYW